MNIIAHQLFYTACLQALEVTNYMRHRNSQVVMWGDIRGKKNARRLPLGARRENPCESPCQMPAGPQHRTTSNKMKHTLLLLILPEETAPLSPLTTVTEFILFQKLSPK